MRSDQDNKSQRLLLAGFVSAPGFDLLILSPLPLSARNGAFQIGQIKHRNSVTAG